VWSRDSVQSYDHGILAAVSSIFLLAVLLYQDGLLAQDGAEAESWGSAEQLGLRIAQLVLVVLGALSSISLPRRPEVFYEGKPVDGMFTVSALGRYNFTWVAPLLAMSRKKNRLELEDLPIMDHRTRSKDLSEAWASKEHKRALWIEVFLAHKGSFMAQWFLTLLQAFGNFAPQFVIFHILKILEKRTRGRPVGVRQVQAVPLGTSTTRVTNRLPSSDAPRTKF
jgi:hypothetical protein